MARVQAENLSTPDLTSSTFPDLGFGTNSIMSAPDSSPGVAVPGPGDVKDVRPAVRNTVRLCLSAKEYRVLYDVAVKRVPALKNKLPSSLREDPAALARNRHSLAAVRASLRVFVGSSVALKLVEMIMNRVKGNALQYDVPSLNTGSTHLTYPSIGKNLAPHSFAPQISAFPSLCPSYSSSTVSYIASS